MSARVPSNGGLRTARCLQLGCPRLGEKGISECGPATSKLCWPVALSERGNVMPCHGFIRAWEYVIKVSPTKYCDTSSQMSRFVPVFHPLSGSDLQ